MDHQPESEASTEDYERTENTDEIPPDNNDVIGLRYLAKLSGKNQSSVTPAVKMGFYSDYNWVGPVIKIGSWRDENYMQLG